MRQTIIVIALTAGLLSGAAWPQDIEPLQTASMPTSGDYWAQMLADRLERQARFDELMAAMVEEMATIRKTSDRDKRQALMTIHREHMRAAIELMRGMGGERMRNIVSAHTGASGNSDRSGDSQKSIPSSRPRTEMSDAQRLSDIEIRLDMMQVIMESLMESDAESVKATR
ncbi:MAG: hypothetical protein GTO41_03695 [Burkholderiales bacterium]|nr:hypothetical protein [Burkholderiales bacterium]